MAHWQALCQGRGRVAVTRLGGKDSGARAYVASWAGRCAVYGYVNESGVDCIRVVLEQHHGAGADGDVIYDGPINGAGKGTYE